MEITEQKVFGFMSAREKEICKKNSVGSENFQSLKVVFKDKTNVWPR